MKKITAIVGNNAEKSTNRQLIQYIANRYKDIADIEIMEVDGFPMFNKPSNMVLPEFVKEQVARIEKSDGVIIATLEYDHAPPAALSNALAWMTYGVYPFVSKPVLVTGASYGTLGSSRAQTQLRQMMRAPETRANVMPGSEFLLNHSLQAFDEAGNLVDEEKTELLDAIIHDFMTYIDVNATLTEAIKANKKAAVEHSWEMP